MASTEVYRIEIPIEAIDEYNIEFKKVKKEVDGLEKTIQQGTEKAKRHMTGFEKAVSRTTQRINQRLDRLTRGRWSMTLRAVDHASRVIRKVSMFAQRVTARSYRIAVRALDYATRPLRSIVSSMGSILATVGIVGGVAGGLVMPIKMTIERQNITTAFEVLLGSADAANKRIQELTEFAGQTPYTRDEIYEASRVLEVFTKGALSTGDGLRMIGDVAAGTQQEFGDVALWMGRMYDAMASGRPVGEMTSRLQEMGAISGDARARLEKLAESGKDISKIWPEATKEFDRYNGMMEKLSDNLANLLLGVKTSFMNNVLMRWGQGIEKGLSPALKKFRQWRKDNEDLITGMGDKIEVYGEKMTKGFVDKIGRGFSLLRGVFLPTKKELENMSQLEMFLPEMDQGTLLKDMTFGAKIKLVIDKANNVFSDWWEETGREQVTGMSGKMGTAFGEMLNGAIMGALGLDSERENTFVSAGFEAGSSFVKGFLEGFDAGDVAAAIGKKLLDINIQGVTGAVKGEGFGGLAGAAFVDLLVLGALSKLLKPLGNLGKKIGGGALGAGGWIWSTVTGKGKGKENPKGAERQKEHTQKHQQNQTTNTKNTKGPLILDHRGNPIESSTKNTGNNSGPANNSNNTGNGRRPPKFKMPKGAEKALNLGKRIPYIGALLTAATLAGTSKEEIPGALGAIGGGLGGAALGATVGSAVPLVGTAIGGIVGGIAGSIGGEKFTNWMWGKFGGGGSGKLEATSNEGPIITGDAVPVPGMGGAIMMQQASIVAQNMQALATWVAQSSGWVVGAFQPLQGSGELINHNVNALKTWLAHASMWVVGAFSPLEGQGRLTAHNLIALNTWLAQSSSWVVDAFHPLQAGGATIIHNFNALNTWLAQSSGWVVGAFQPMISGGQLVQHNLYSLATWVAQSSGWVVGTFQPLQASGKLVIHNLSALATWTARASGWVASLHGIQTGAADVNSALSGLASRIRNASVPSGGGTIRQPSMIRAYAKGTNYHPGGPAIVGDGGGAELIQFPSGRMALSPATDTLVNLPRGTKVMPHHKTARMMQVPDYAEGIGTVDIPDYTVTGTIGNSVNVDVGGIQVTIVIEGAENMDTESLNDKIVDELAEAIATKITHAGSNMPA